MFIGQSHQALGKANRLPLPVHFRAPLSDGVFITQGFDRNLWVHTARAFRAICLRVTSMNITDPMARLLQRMIIGTATELDMDETGGIHIPQNLREFADLNDEVILVGQGDYFEVWSPDLWHEQETQLQDAETNARRFVMLDLAMT